MNETTKNLKGAIDACRSITKQVELLLTVADGFVKDDGWKVRKDRTIDVQRGLKSSFKWIPGYFFRAYRSDRYPKITAFFCAIISEPWDDPEVAVAEPLMSACWCFWGNSKKPSNALDTSWACWHLAVTDRKDDGTICHENVKEKWPESFKEGISDFYSFAVPLDKITGEETLKVEVVDRFFAGVKKHAEKPKKN